MGVFQDWQNSIPAMKQVIAIILLIVNIFFPGIGTMISACVGGGKLITDQLLVGLLQWLTAFCIVGWIWSIYWGILMVQKAN